MNRTILEALAELAPQDNPELKALPITKVAVGDTVLVIWLEGEARFLVKDVCADDTVDLKEQVSGGCINVSLCDVRVVEKGKQ